MAQQLAIGNISRGGLFVRCQHPIPTGTRLEVVLQLPEDMTLKVEGEVVHTIADDASGAATGFGLRFDERYAIDLNLLEGIAASNSGGCFSFALNADDYISLDAVLVDAGTGETTVTTAHKLVEVPSTEVDLDDLSGDDLRGDTDGVARIVSLPDEDEREPGGPKTSGRAAKARAVPVAVPVTPASETSAPAPSASRAGSPAAAAPAPLQDAAAEPIFGIDFGTTYTSIAVVDGNQIRVLQDGEGQTSLPSVVCYPETGPVLVGWPAKEKIATHPSSTISSAKRLLGRQYDDPHLQGFFASSAAHFTKSRDGLVMAEIFGEPVSMVQVAAEVLRRIAAIGEAAVERPVRRVVISAPVAYGGERESLRRAAELAGLEVAGTIDEPVAAAMAFGIGMEGGRTIAVYDFGGGTLDITVLRNKPKRGYEVLAKSGDPWLGGDDFDRAIADYAADQFWRVHKVDLRQRQVEWQRLLLHCEQAKRRLSVQQHVELRVRAILLTLKGPVDLRLDLERGQLDQICGQLVERSLDTVRECLEQAGLEPSQVDQVVLTGGTSRSPLVRRSLQELFGREITVNYDPELAIVSGNALYGRFVGLKR